MKIFKLFKSNKRKHNYLIIQMGPERSLIQNVSDINNPILMVKNEHLMNLDENGCVLK